MTGGNDIVILLHGVHIRILGDCVLFRLIVVATLRMLLRGADHYVGVLRVATSST